MNELQSTISVKFCKLQKRLDRKTLKSYRIDLSQFEQYQTKHI